MIGDDAMRDRWRLLWAVVGGVGEPDDIVRRYSEPHRAYHTLQHIGECLAQFDAARHLAADAAAVELALWYHDAVYDPLAKDNEERSAALAVEGLRDAGLARRVRALVLATRHEAVPDDPDARLLVDVDLSILGAPPGRFDEYERQIRREYAMVPDSIFAAKREEILRSFLARPAIYSTPHFHALLERAARENLVRVIPQRDSRNDLPGAGSASP